MALIVTLSRLNPNAHGRFPACPQEKKDEYGYEYDLCKYVPLDRAPARSPPQNMVKGDVRMLAAMASKGVHRCEPIAPTSEPVLAYLY